MSKSLIGFLQALGIILYAALVSGIFEILETTIVKAPRFYGPVVILALLIFSAAVSGSIVFAYPAYLALNKKVKEGLSVLAYTLLYALGMIVIIIVLMAALA